MRQPHVHPPKLQCSPSVAHGSPPYAPIAFQRWPQASHHSHVHGYLERPTTLQPGWCFGPRSPLWAGIYKVPPPPVRTSAQRRSRFSTRAIHLNSTHNKIAVSGDPVHASMPCSISSSLRRRVHACVPHQPHSQSLSNAAIHSAVVGVAMPIHRMSSRLFSWRPGGDCGRKAWVSRSQLKHCGAPGYFRGVGEMSWHAR
mgnify:CR=1 FL=1